MSEDALKNNKETLDGLRTGDHIKFHGTIQALGDSHHLHHLHAWSVKQIDGHMEGIDVRVSEQGRYKLSNMPNIDAINDKTQ